MIEAGRAKPGILMIVRGFPCKVITFATAKPGKHGSAKAMVTAEDIFTGKVYSETFGTGDLVPAPAPEKENVLCTGIESDGTMKLVREGGELLHEF